MEENISCKMDYSDSESDCDISDREEKENIKKTKKVLRLPYIYPGIYKKLVQATCETKGRLFSRPYDIMWRKERTEYEADKEINQEERNERFQKRVDQIHELVYKNRNILADFYDKDENNMNKVDEYVKLLLTYDKYNKLHILKNKTKLNNDIIFNIIIKYMP